MSYSVCVRESINENMPLSDLPLGYLIERFHIVHNNMIASIMMTNAIKCLSYNKV